MRDEVCSLRQSYQMARMYRASTSGRVSRGLAVKSSAQSAETRLTLTLVCVVAMFLLLVTPSELINLYFYAAKSTVTFPATGCYCVSPSSSLSSLSRSQLCVLRQPGMTSTNGTSP